MKLLITPREVVAAAFPCAPETGSEHITESLILSAQHKFIRPVVGGLYEKLENGAYAELLTLYLKPALAQYVRYMALPQLAASVGRLGIVEPKGPNFAPAGGGTLRALRKSARSQAEALLRTAVEHIEARPKEFPEYRPEENVLNRVSVASGVVL